MKKLFNFILIALVVLLLPLFFIKAEAKSYMSDKTEIPVNLEISGAEALCQTDDGYIWIAQYSGLTRYDSKEYVTYKDFEENGQKYDIINVRALQTKDNVLYIATDRNLFIYSDNHFKRANVDAGTIRDIILNDVTNDIYISSDSGLFIYHIDKDTEDSLKMTDKAISDCVLDTKRNDYYYQLPDGVYNSKGDVIYSYPKLTEIYGYEDTMLICQDDGLIHTYNFATKELKTSVYNVSNQTNKLLYSKEDNALYVGGEAVLSIIDLETKEVSYASGLENGSKLIDLLIDYEGNLWVASHNVTASGVSIITQNALTNLLYDDSIWNLVGKGKEESEANTRKNIHAIERYENKLYIVATADIFIYDLESNKILEDNPIMDKIIEYAQTIYGTDYENKFFTNDAEIYKNKVYFVVSNIGLVEYNPVSNDVVIYGKDYVENHLDTTGESQVSILDTVRCLRVHDDYLILGSSSGLLRFDGTTFKLKTGFKVLYLNEDNNGTLLFNTTKGIFKINDDFINAEEIPTDNGVSGNRLKFMVDGDYLYFNLNSRLFRTYLKDGKREFDEITLPYIKGSILELSKIKFLDSNGKEQYKYVIVSQTQIYITSSLDSDNLNASDGNKLINYEFYDSTNGLPSIIANTSGYYDSETSKYYFQTAAGIFVYNLSETKENITPVKMAVNSVDLDGVHYYGNNLELSRYTYRVEFNLSIFGFKPNKGYTIYYKLDGVDDDYRTISDINRSVTYTNLSGGSYKFHAYAVDEYGQVSNEIHITLEKEKYVYEQAWFWIVISVIAIALVLGLNFLLIKIKTRASLKRQLEYKNITVESIQAIARTIDAKDEYTNGHSIRVGYYSKLIAQSLNMKEDEVDNIYYIALLHDIGKIAIPDSILNKPGRLTDEEFAVMKSHTTRGAKILNGISTIPQIIEGAKSHHEKYDGSGYPEGLKGEDIPFVARIICCADCFDAMASKRVYKEPFGLEKIIGEFERCSGTQFDPAIAHVVVEMIKAGKLKPYTAENTYLGSDGKTHRIKKEDKE